MDNLKYTVIKNRKQYDEYCRILDGLLEIDEPTREQGHEMELLTVLIEKWDADHSPFKDLDPIAILRSLMKEHGLEASDMIKILGISKSYLSEVLNYKKGLSKEVIRKLAAHFKMAQEAFNRPYSLKALVSKGVKQAARKDRHSRRKMNPTSKKRLPVKKAAAKKKMQPA